MFYQQFPTAYETHTRVVMGINCIETLVDELKYYQAQRVMVVSDPHICLTEFYQNCLHYVEAAGCQCFCYNQVEEEAPLRNVETLRALLLENNCDLLIAVGGGSVIDVCKGASVLATNGGKAQDWAGYEKYSIAPLRLFTIPTTAGTASEVTSMGIIHDEEAHVKFTIAHRVLGCPAVTLLDGNALASCPRSVIAQAGIDAFSHSFESYIALKANPMTEAMSLQGIRYISRNLRYVYGNSRNALAAQDLMAGSTMGGLAFTTTGCGNGHCLGRHVGPQFGLNHGLSIALVLPAVARFNFFSQMEKYRHIAEAMDIEVAHLPLAEVGEAVVEAISKLIRDVGIKQTLGDFQPRPEDLQAIAEDSYRAYQAHYHQKNPAKMCRNDFLDILEDCR